MATHWIIFWLPQVKDDLMIVFVNLVLHKANNDHNCCKLFIFTYKYHDILNLRPS